MMNIIEISTDNKELSSYRGFLRIKERGDVLKNIPFDSFTSLIITGNGILLSANLLSSLCEYGIPLVILGNNYHPNGILTSLVGQQRQMEIQHLQTEISQPLKKNLWAEIVKEKIKNQSVVLDIFKKENKIRNMHSYVLSGDTDNKEGTAARFYFPALFGGDFIRDPNEGGINSFLNYGYAIMRAMVARYAVASGLNVSFGVNHKNKLNPFCLVDDLMEVYRPIVDLKVYQLFDGVDNKEKLLAPEDKKEFVGLINAEIYTEEGSSPLHMIVQRDIWNFVNSVKEKKILLNFNKNMVRNVF